MTKPASRSRLPENTPTGFSSLAFGIPSDRTRRRRCRPSRSPLFIAAGCGSGRERSIQATPLLHWRFDEVGSRGGVPQTKPGGETLRKHRKPAGVPRPDVSARRLAAGIWNLRVPKVVCGGEASLDLETNYGQLHLPYVSSGNCSNLHPNPNEDFISLLANKNRRNDISHKLKVSASLLPSSIERATKWDTGYPKVSKGSYDLYDNLKLLEHQKTGTISVVSALRSALELARSKVNELEAERQSTNKKLDRFMRKIEEEKAAWRRREHEKIRSVIDAMKEDLIRERKNALRMEIMNSKLINDLTEAKLSAKQFLQEYEKERKARELMEEVCNELAKEIGDDKAEVEALKMESVKTREEVEEERKMLQIAEVWREERVQMKLIDAKVTLQEKYSKLSKLEDEIEAFLTSESGNNYDVSDTKQAEALKEAVGSVKTHDMKEFSYQPPPASDGIFSIFEEIKARDQANKKGTEQCYGSLTPEVNAFSEKHMKRYDNLIFDGNCDAEDDSGWETVSHVEEQDSCKSPNGSEPSVNGVFVESQASVSGTDLDDLGDEEKQNSEISEVCSITTKQSTKKGSSLSRLWKSSRASNADDFKKMSFELTSGSLCNGRSFNATLSTARKSAETGLSSPSVGNWSSPDLLNPHITQGMKDRVEWPQATKKQSLKAKLMEARIQNQKVQLRQVLKQKI